MEGTRIAIGLGFFGIALYGFLSFTAVPEAVTIQDATLHPMGNALIFTGRIDNPGASDRLTGIGSDAAARALLTHRDLVVPAGSAPTLAMDGAHGVLMGLRGTVQDGQLIPVTLWFENAGRVASRARVSATAMDHSQRYDVPPDEPTPSLSIALSPDEDAWHVTLDTSDFTFSRDAVDGDHAPGIGHAHIYLNGLKLQRLYGKEAQIGALPAGQYELRVTLNTNDHRTYAVAGVPVSAAIALSVE